MLSLSEALRNEVAPFGIKVCCILPGDVNTGFTSARRKNLSDDPAYGDRVTRAVEAMERDERGGMPPEVSGFGSSMSAAETVAESNRNGSIAVIFITAEMGAALCAGLGFIAVVMGIFMDCLELLVAFLQAYIFTMLSAVFIGLAHPDPVED